MDDQDEGVISQTVPVESDKMFKTPDQFGDFKMPGDFKVPEFKKPEMNPSPEIPVAAPEESKPMFKKPEMNTNVEEISSEDPVVEKTENKVEDMEKKVSFSENMKTISESDKPQKSPAEKVKANSLPLPYKEPSWGGIPEKKYHIEVLKNGSIVERIELKGQSFFVVGRLENCDITLEHPSLSRYHAVLQFKSQGSPEKPVGFYLFDLDSTHGTFHNKQKCFPKTYYRIRVGHMLKFGGSTRVLLLQGPPEDEEEENELSVTELKAKAAEKARKKQEDIAERRRKEEEEEDKDENDTNDTNDKGISWGMDDDEPEDEEFPNMENNPFAETAENESLYIDDPKKTLTAWFEREGCELVYNVEEKGYANFVCKIALPVDMPNGGPASAEATVKGGKKKDAVIQAALEACRVLDRMGLLRQAKQEALARKIKRWEDDDFYDSDDDEFLDRTGSIADKRQKRMKIAGKSTGETETYDSLLSKHGVLQAELIDVEKQLKKATEKRAVKEKGNGDDLDMYLASLKGGAQVDKETVTKLKLKMQSLRQESDRLVKLINITKPASMPELKPSQPEKPKSMAGIMIGKRFGKGGFNKLKTISASSIVKPVTVVSEQTKVLNAFLESESSQEKVLKKNEEEEIQPIGYEERKEPVAQPRIGDTSGNAKVEEIIPKGPLIPKGPQIPDSLRKVLEEQSAIAEMGKEGDTDDVNDDDGGGEKKKKGKRGDRGATRKRKNSEEIEDSFYKVGEDERYAVWLPPQGQSGDGKTSLNDKLGY